MWKDKMDALKKVKEEKGEKVEIPPEDVIIKNAEKCIMKANKIEAIPIFNAKAVSDSDQKQLTDAQEQLDKLQKLQEAKEEIVANNAEK